MFKWPLNISIISMTLQEEFRQIMRSLSHEEPRGGRDALHGVSQSPPLFGCYPSRECHGDWWLWFPQLSSHADTAVLTLPERLCSQTPTLLQQTHKLVQRIFLYFLMLQCCRSLKIIHCGQVTKLLVAPRLPAALAIFVVFAFFK